MHLEYIESRATLMPIEIDTESSKKYVYLRKDIKEETISSGDGTTSHGYVFQEAKVPKDEYYHNRVIALEAENNDMKNQLAEQAEALIELAGLIG